MNIQQRQAEACKRLHDLHAKQQEREFVLIEGRARMDNLKGQSKLLIEDRQETQFFPTPPGLAKIMVERADFLGQESTLEPSAGGGNLVREIEKHTQQITLVENDSRLCGDLYDKFHDYRLMQRDFLSMDPKANGEGLYHRVIMNPPFTRGADIKHIEHAISFLRKGGRLIALCYAGVKQKRWLEENNYKHELFEGMFKASKTNAPVYLVEINA